MKLISPEQMVGYSEFAKVSRINKVCSRPDNQCLRGVREERGGDGGGDWEGRWAEERERKAL